MPRKKDLKRLVRARMQKTGEAYTAARTQILKKPRAKRPTSTAPRAAGGSARAPADYAAIAGMSDAAVDARTGRTWERWVQALDGDGAARLPHREIAALLGEKYAVPDWWSQMVAVGYERIKGLRARGQRRDGTYEASKSRTFDVPAATLFEACADPAVRRRWLDVGGVKVRTAIAPKSMRLGWPDGSIVALWLTAKGASKSALSVQHTKLPDRATADRQKAFWSDRLDALREVLAGR